MTYVNEKAFWRPRHAPHVLEPSLMHLKRRAVAGAMGAIARSQTTAAGRIGPRRIHAPHVLEPSLMHLRRRPRPVAGLGALSGGAQFGVIAGASVAGLVGGALAAGVLSPKHRNTWALNGALGALGLSFVILAGKSA